MLEMYRAGTDHRGTTEDLEQALEAGARALHPSDAIWLSWRGHEVDWAAPFDRMRVADAFARAGADLEACGKDAGRLRAAARAGGSTPGWYGVFFYDVSSGPSCRLLASLGLGLHALCT